MEGTSSRRGFSLAMSTAGHREGCLDVSSSLTTQTPSVAQKDEVIINAFISGICEKYSGTSEEWKYWDSQFFSLFGGFLY